MNISIKEHDAAPVLRHTEAARYLGVSPNQLRLSRHTGELFKGVATPAYLKIGNAVRYRNAQISQGYESQTARGHDPRRARQ